MIQLSNSLYGCGITLPNPSIPAARFRLNLFLEWCNAKPFRIHQVAAAILMQNGLTAENIQVLREHSLIELTEPTDFYAEFDRILADQPRGTIANYVFSLIHRQWISAVPHLELQRLRGVAAIMLVENGFTTEMTATVLGWQAKGSATRAIQSARKELKAVVAVN